METCTVYRVEHKTEGHGPYLKFIEEEDDNGESYRYSGSHDEVAGLHSAHEASDDHPGPAGDGLYPYMRDEHVHGFDSREKLDTWFAGFKRKLDRAGFVVNVYKAPFDSWYPSDSGKQCIFRKDLSTLVDTQSVIGYSSYKS